jgi:hypothetical protein
MNGIVERASDRARCAGTSKLPVSTNGAALASPRPRIRIAIASPLPFVDSAGKTTLSWVTSRAVELNRRFIRTLGGIARASG